MLNQEQLRRQLRVSIPYRIYGGLRFYERLEIKNAISYLRIIFNNNDNPSFERSISNPTRGVGEKTLAKIRNAAKQYNISYIKASAKLIDEGKISGRGGSGLKDYLEFIAGCKGFIEENSLSDLMELQLLRETGLYAYHAKEAGEKGKTRTENLEELITATKNFEQSIKDERTNIEIAESYLDIISLDSGDRQASEHDDAAQLMTMHSAKGLEFKLVLLTGLEESLSARQINGECIAVRRGKEALLCCNYKSNGKTLHYTCRIKASSWNRYL